MGLWALVRTVGYILNDMRRGDRFPTCAFKSPLLLCLENWPKVSESRRRLRRCRSERFGGWIMMAAVKTESSVKI